MARSSGAIVVCLALIACSSGTEPARRGLHRIQLTLEPDVGALMINDTARARVSGFDAAGAAYPAGPVSWRSTSPTVFAIDDDGLAEGRATGSAMLIATVGHVSDTVALEVGGTLHDQSIVADEQWTAAGSPHLVRGRLTAGANQGATVTIEAGSEILFENGSGLTFGASGIGALVAAGTTAAPISMRGASSTPTPGSWIGLTFRGPVQSELRHVTLSGCGGARSDDQPSACVVLGQRFPESEPTLLVQNVTVRDALSAAMVLQWESRFAPGSTGLSAQNVQGHVATIPAAAAGNFPYGGSFAGNSLDELRLTEDTIRESATWTNGGLTWSVLGRVFVEGVQAPVLTLAPGSSFRLTGGGFVVGKNASGGLHVGAPAGGPVELTAGGANGWAGIQFFSNATASTITNTALDDCGNAASSGFGDGCFSVIGNFFGSAPAPVLQNVTIRRAFSSGITLVGGGRFGAGSDNVTITQTAGSPGTPITVSLASSPASIPIGTYTGNALDAIWMFAWEVRSSETWRALGVPYMMRQGLDIGNVTNPVLTLEAGVELRFSPAGFLVVGALTPGALRAIGTASAPVSFTGELSHPGAWMGVDVGAHALPTTLIDHVIVDYGGADDGSVAAGIRIARDIGAIVRNTLIRRSGGCGIMRIAGAPWTTNFTAAQYGNSFEDNAGADQCGP